MNRTPYQYQHLAPVVEIDNEKEWKEDYIEEILSVRGDYYPFKPENFNEALSEMDYPHLKVAAACFGVADETNADSAIQCAYFSIKLHVNEYWMKAAKAQANRDYQEVKK